MLYKGDLRDFFPFYKLTEFIPFKHMEFISLNKGSSSPLGKISARRYKSWWYPWGDVVATADAAATAGCAPGELLSQAGKALRALLALLEALLL